MWKVLLSDASMLKKCGPKNELRRLHPSLVPYADLSDEVKEYDRVYVRQTQDACAALR